MSTKQHLGILLSGRGSNFRAIHQAIELSEIQDADISIVISNKADAPGLSFAKEQGLERLYLKPSNFHHREAYDLALLEALKKHRVDWVILAGYNRIISPILVEAYRDRMLNIHPSLLPKHGGPGMWGERVHQAVLDASEQESGCSVHLVSEDVDAGTILGQAKVPVLINDTPETLAARVLAAEHQLYPRVIQEILHCSSSTQDFSPIRV